MREDALRADRSGIRLDAYLAKRYQNLSRSYLKGLIERGCVSVDGSSREPDFRLAGGELIRIQWAETAWGDVPFEDWVLHEDEELLVLNKPPGLIVHPLGGSWLSNPRAALSEAEPSVAGLLLKLRPALASRVERLGLVHRLDRQTSGVMLVAKKPGAQKELLDAFRERRVLKTYRAIVLGDLTKATVEAPIGRKPGKRRMEVTPWGRAAQTRFRALDTAKGLSLVEAEPKTGRTHQIRAHLAHLGHPVAGDPEWCREPELSRLQASGFQPPPRMMLHAWRIRFKHPGTGKEAAFTAPVPKDFRDYWWSVRG